MQDVLQWEQQLTTILLEACEQLLTRSVGGGLCTSQPRRLCDLAFAFDSNPLTPVQLFAPHGVWQWP